MTGCGTVRFEGIIRFFLVTFQVGYPFLRKMFRNTPFVFGSPFYDMINDSSGTLSVSFVVQNICNGKESFYRVHVGIQTTIVV